MDARLLVKSVAKTGGNISVNGQYTWFAPGIEGAVAAVIYEHYNSNGVADTEVASYSNGDFTVTCSIEALKTLATNVANSVSDQIEDTAWQNEVREKLQELGVAVSALTVLFLNL